MNLKELKDCFSIKRDFFPHSIQLYLLFSEFACETRVFWDAGHRIDIFHISNCQPDAISGDQPMS